MQMLFPNEVICYRCFSKKNIRFHLNGYLRIGVAELTPYLIIEQANFRYFLLIYANI